MKAPASRTKKGGYVDSRRLPKGPNGRSLCRWCSTEVPNGRRTFCSHTCVHEWRLRTDGGYLREQVFDRDKGICANCGTDTEAVRKELRKLDYRARRELLSGWGMTERARRSFWEADHILPVALGGGQCDLSNMRTLCLKCHREATAQLRLRLRGAAAQANATYFSEPAL